MNPIVAGNLRSKTSWAAILLMALGGLEQSGLLALIPDEYKGIAISAVGALMLFLRNITTQAVTAKAVAQGDAANKQGGFARPLVLVLLITIAAPLLLLSACQTPPSKVVQAACDPSAYTAERCAKGIAETWEVYQRRAEEIVTDAATPDDVKQPIKRAEAYTRPAIVEMLKSAAAYKRIKDEFAAGATDEEKLRIADARLEEWVRVALPRIDAMGDALGL